MKNKSHVIAYKTLKAILSPIYKFWYNPKIYGAENIPKDGPIIIAGNHKHLMDQCALIVSTKRVIRYMAKMEYSHHPFSWFFKSTGCIFVDRSIHDKNAKGAAIDVLKEGGAIGIFPEGTRNKTEAFLLPFKFGTVSMAAKTDAQIVPFGISGDYKFRSKNLRIYIGKPFKVKANDLENANKLLVQKIGDLMKKGMKEQSK